MALGGAAARSAGRPSSSHLWQEPSRLSRMQELSVRMRRRARATAARAAQFGKFGVQSRVARLFRSGLWKLRCKFLTEGSTPRRGRRVLP